MTSYLQRTLWLDIGPRSLMVMGTKLCSYCTIIHKHTHTHTHTHTHFSEIFPFFANKTFLKLYRPIVLRMNVRFLSLHHTLSRWGQQPRTLLSHHKILVKHLIFVVYLKMLTDVWLSKNPTNKNVFNSWRGRFESKMPHWEICQISYKDIG